MGVLKSIIYPLTVSSEETESGEEDLLSALVLLSVTVIGSPV